MMINYPSHLIVRMYTSTLGEGGEVNFLKNLGNLKLFNQFQIVYTFQDFAN